MDGLEVEVIEVVVSNKVYSKMDHNSGFQHHTPSSNIQPLITVHQPLFVTIVKEKVTSHEYARHLEQLTELDLWANPSLT